MVVDEHVMIPAARFRYGRRAHRLESEETLAQNQARQLQFGQRHGMAAGPADPQAAAKDTRVKELRAEVVQLSNDNRKLRGAARKPPNLLQDASSVL